MKIRLTDATVTTCRVIEFRGGYVWIDGEQMFEADFYEDVVRIADDDVTDGSVKDEKHND